jgi:hypothetical protein
MIRLLFTTALFVFWQASAAEFWISTSGNDMNQGTKSKPFATLEKARDAVRQSKEQGSAQKPVTVWLRKGDYLRTNTLELSTADSATAQSPIVWRAFEHEPVRLLGGRLLTGFTPVTNPIVLARFDKNARNHVVQLNLRDLGLSNFGELKSRGFGRTSAPAHCELFCNQKPMILARWPNEGQFEKIEGYPASADRKDEHGGKLGVLSDGFFYSGDHPRNWHDTDELWVHGYWAYDWANSYEKVAVLDLDQRLVKTAAPHGLYGFRKGQRFYFLNVLEELDQPGEWFLDRTSGILYFWPPSPKDQKKPEPEILFSLLGKPLLKLSGVSHVTFQGIAFEATRATAIEIQDGSSNRIVGCLIRNVGNSGVIIQGGVGHGVVSCDITDTGDGGVSLTGGDRQTLAPGGHFVENSHFQRQGRWSKCYVPAVALSGVGLRASHNLIHDHPHSAILFSGNDHLMEFNEIHHIALETGDVGAIYTGRDYTFRGNRIRYNYIHHTGGVGMGSMGVYMDDCVSGTEIFGNVFYKVHWAMFLGGGRDHRVENNIFVDCDPAVRADGRGLDTTPVWRSMVDDYMRGKLAEVPAALYRSRYPEIKSLDKYYGPPDGPALKGEAFKGVPPEGNVIVKNVCAGKWLEAGWHATPQTLRLENNLTNALTSFVSSKQDREPATDFELQKDSPAWNLGFQPIPLKQIGLQHDDLRQDLTHLLNNPAP